MPEFFDEQEEQSAIKADIVVAYFDAWSRIMAARSNRIAYLDFFAGPGRYGSGKKSTPLLLLEMAIKSPALRRSLVTVFNDKSPKYVRALKAEIDALDGIEQMVYRPDVWKGEVTDEIAAFFESMHTVPALSFIDPWGYKGLSRRLIHAVMKDWGCDVIFFFNYNRINPGLTNPKVSDRMADIFGTDRLALMHKKTKDRPSAAREEIVRECLWESLYELGAEYPLTFTFRRKSGRPRHYVCFACKDFLGYDIMKGIMAKRSDKDEEGIPLFEFQPRRVGTQLKLEKTFSLARLRADILKQFAGRTLTRDDIYKGHTISTPYIRENYTGVLSGLETEGLIRCERAPRARAGTFGEKTLVTFPRQP